MDMLYLHISKHNTMKKTTLIATALATAVFFTGVQAAEAQVVKPRAAFGLSTFGLELHGPSAVLSTSGTITERWGRVDSVLDSRR